MSLEPKRLRKFGKMLLLRGDYVKIFLEIACTHKPSCQFMGEITKENTFMLECLHNLSLVVNLENKEVFLKDHCYGIHNFIHRKGKPCIRLKK